MRPAWHIWRDRRGGISWLRLATLALLLLPLAIALYDARAIVNGARPLNDVIHRTGFWALIFLLLSLAVTPFRRAAHYGGLIDVRRMIGVAAFIYAAAHFILYVVDLRYDLVKVASEIVSRLYLTVGFLALIGLAVLAATSTDTMVKRLGGQRWKRLHQAVYAITLLALIHYFQQTKADVAVPVFTASLFGWLIAYRILAWKIGGSALNAKWLLALAVTVSALTFIAEAVGVGLAFSVSPLVVLQAAFDVEAIRPGWQVLMAGLAVALLEAVRARLAAKPVSSRKPASAVRS